MQQTIRALKNHIKISDWGSVLKDFDALSKQLEKASQVVAKEGVPRFYLKQVQPFCRVV